jgi:tetratricopeptide (TPR) repeat protein
MKSLAFAAGIAALAIPFSAASAQVWTIGGPLARLCYESALAQDARYRAADNCTRSLQEEALTTSDAAATLVNRGILHMLRGVNGAADADFNAALAIDNRKSDAWLNKGFLRLKQNNGREALPLIEEGIKRGPQRPALAIFGRGLAYEQMGNLKAAYGDMARARDLEPGWTLPGTYLARHQLREH